MKYYEQNYTCLLLCFTVAIASNTSGSSHLIHQLTAHHIITFKVYGHCFMYLSFSPAFYAHS